MLLEPIGRSGATLFRLLYYGRGCFLKRVNTRGFFGSEECLLGEGSTSRYEDVHGKPPGAKASAQQQTAKELTK